MTHEDALRIIELLESLRMSAYAINASLGILVGIAIANRFLKR